MNDVYEAALQVQRTCEEHGWQFCLIGGLAVVRWGNPRLTQDADFSLLTGFGDERKFIEVLSVRFPGRHPDEDQFAMQFRVYRGLAPNGVPVDIALAAFPFEKEIIKRASDYEFRPDCILTTCSAEDLIVMKAFAGRDQDWADVTNVAACQWKTLNWKSIERCLDDLCEMTDNLVAVPKLQDIRHLLAQQLN